MSQLDYYIILNPIRQGFCKKIFIVFFNKISYEFFVAPLLNCKPFGLQLN